MPDEPQVLPENEVQAPRPESELTGQTTPEGGNPAQWRENLDAGHDQGPTTAHEEAGWREQQWQKP